jgi:hypothetical protein
MGSVVRLNPGTQLARNGRRAASSHLPHAPIGPDGAATPRGRSSSASVSTLRPLAHAGPLRRPRLVRAWRASVAIWWSGIFFELATLAILFAPIVPWMVGIGLMLGWIWVGVR